MSMIPRSSRLDAFFKAVSENPWTPTNAAMANEFLRKYFDAVEEDMLDACYHGNYTFRMMIPSFDIEGAWKYENGIYSWKAREHLIEIQDDGCVRITLDGETVFSAP